MMTVAVMHIATDVPCPKCSAPAMVGCWRNTDNGTLSIDRTRVHPARWVAHRMALASATRAANELAAERERARVAVLRETLRRQARANIPLN